MRTPTKTTLTALALSAVYAQACGPGPNQGNGGAAGSGGNAGTGGNCAATFDSSFAAIEKLIFERRGCTADACHGSATSGGLDLRPGAAYTNLVDARSSASNLARVQPGTALESFLYLKLSAGTNPGSVQITGSPMPVGTEPLTANELEAVKLWIMKGAPETGAVSDPTSGKDVGSLLDACLPRPGPVIAKPLEPPGPDEGIQFMLPSYLLTSGKEVENCTAFAFDFTNEVPAAFKDEARGVMFVNGTRVRQDPQSHHMVLMDPAVDLGKLPDNPINWTCREGARDGQPCNPHNGSADCGEAGVCGYLTKAALGGFGCEVALIDGSTAGGSLGLIRQVANTQAPQEYLPPLSDGAYTELPLKGVFYFNSHAFNLTLEDTTLHARVNYYYTGDRRRKMVPVNVVDNLGIAGGQAPFTKKDYCAKYVVPQGYSMPILASHTHRRGERFWVKDSQGNVIYESLTYNDPVYKHFDPWLTFTEADSASRTLEYCATYNNGVKPDGSPDLNLVTRASRMPDRASCVPVACTAGKLTAPCFTHRDCDSSLGAGDGVCDACAIAAGVTTENEMFVLMPWLLRPEGVP